VATIFQTRGRSVPSLIGREALVSNVVRRLIKPTPDHVQVVGPRLYGKSVILRHLDQNATVIERFPIRLYWDIGHNVPANNDVFLAAIASRLVDALKSQSFEISELVGSPGDRAFDWIHMTVDLLRDEDIDVLIILDGIDKVLLNPAINRTLWDQLRSLGDEFGNLTFVTGSRIPLIELCMTEDAQTSHFWNLFTAPIKVGAFDSRDLSVLHEQFTSLGYKMDQAGATELTNWTGSIPPLVIGMYEYLSDDVIQAGSTINNTIVNELAQGFLADREDLLKVLLRDCSPDGRNILRRLAVGPLSESAIDRSTKKELQDRGLLDVSGRAPKIGSRLVEHYAQNVLRSVENIRREFGDRENFDTNFRDLLELRLGQCTALDNDLRSSVRRMLRDYAEPAAVFMAARDVVDRALDVVWNLELGPTREIPRDWTDYWLSRGVRIIPTDKTLPTERGHQVRLLDLMTGNREGEKVSSVVTKSSQILISFIHDAGNYGNHRTGDSREISKPAASAVCHSAVELCLSIEDDLRWSKEKSQDTTQ
jgi:hypothetical protein